MSLSQVHLSHPKYRPDIDGLRAIAVLSVVGFHAFPTWIEGGFIGVDVFFVISGYLISTIIFENLENKSFSFAEFYARRVRRIFPALALVLIACYAFGWFALLADEYKQLGRHIAAGSGFVSNLVLWDEAGYFDNAAETKPLLHLWSLGIEEQFYLVWPLLLWLAWKSRFNLLAVTAIVWTASFYLNATEVRKDVIAAFYSPQTRFWELLFGSLMAWMAVYRKGSRIGDAGFSNILSVAGLSLLAFGFYSIDKGLAFPGLWAAIPVAAAALIIAAGPKAWLNRVVLSNRIVVWFGLISFPLYLWHWPLLSFAKIIEGETPTRGVRLALVAMSVILAWMTYRLIEWPIRRGGYGRAKAIALLVIVASVGGIGYGTYRMNGLEFREFHKSYEQVVKAKSDWWPVEGDATDKSVKRIVSNPDRYTVFLGDSHAEQYYSRVAYLRETTRGKSNSVIFLSKLGCPPFKGLKHASEKIDVSLGNCGEDRRIKLKNVMDGNIRISDVVVAFCWACYLSNDYPGVENASSAGFYWFNDGVRMQMNDPGSVGHLLPELIRELQGIVKKETRIWILIDNPIGDNFRPENELKGRRLSGFDASNAVRMTKVSDGQLILRERIIGIARESGVRVMDPYLMLCTGTECARLDQEGVPIYKDADHLRASFIYAHAAMIDAALGMAPETAGLKKMPVRN